MMDQSLAWYQERFGEMKIDFQTRRNHADHEVLVLLLESGPCRVTYISVDSSGVVVCAEPGVRLYADWRKGDRFVRMFEAMRWVGLPVPVSPPQMCWDEYAAWEVMPPLKR